MTDLLVGLCDRGLDVTRPVLAVLAGAKALAAAVNAVFDHPIIGRCQLHKIRNVKSKLPDKLAATVTAKMHAAYKMTDALAAEAALADPASSSGDTPARPGRCARGLPRR